jgi:hypothetical protein
VAAQSTPTTAAAGVAAAAAAATAAAEAASVGQLACWTTKVTAALCAVGDLLLLEDSELLLQHPYVVPGGGALGPFFEGYLDRAKQCLQEGRHDQAFAELDSLHSWLVRRQVHVEPGSVPPGFTQP